LHRGKGKSFWRSFRGIKTTSSRRPEASPRTMKRAPSGTDSNLLAPRRKAIQTFELPYSGSAVRELGEGLART
jgi:hypothetical protein